MERDGNDLNLVRGGVPHGHGREGIGTITSSGSRNSFPSEDRSRIVGSKRLVYSSFFSSFNVRRVQELFSRRTSLIANIVDNKLNLLLKLTVTTLRWNAMERI